MHVLHDAHSICVFAAWGPINSSRAKITVLKVQAALCINPTGNGGDLSEILEWGVGGQMILGHLGGKEYGDMGTYPPVPSPRDRRAHAHAYRQRRRKTFKFRRQPGPKQNLIGLRGNLIFNDLGCSY